MSEKQELAVKAIDAGGREGARQIVRSMDDLARVSKLLAASGYFQDAQDAAQAGVKVLAGMEMGIGAFSSMAGIHVIKGKPSIGAGLMAAAVKRSGKYDYRVRKHSGSECVIEFFERGESCGVSEFTLDDAKAAGLLNNDNWKKAPRNMLFARALSNGVRWYAPDVFDTSVYVPEEMGAEVDEEGNVIRVEPVTSTPKRAAVPEPVIEAEIVEANTEAALVTPDQLKRISKLIKANAFETPASARAFFAYRFGREIASSRDLTQSEADQILTWTQEQWDEFVVDFANVTA